MTTPLMLAHSFARSVEEAPVRAVVGAFTEAWNTLDPAAFANLFAEDAELVDVASDRHHGRTAVVAAHVDGPGGPMAESHYRLRDMAVRWLAPEIAVAQATWQMSRRQAAHGRGPSTRAGSLLLILRAGDGGWKIIAAQYTEHPASALSHAPRAA